MGFKRLETINDLIRNDLDLMVRCRCGHKAVLNSPLLAREHVKGTQSRNLRAIRQRLRCTKCRERVADCVPWMHV